MPCTLVVFFYVKKSIGGSLVEKKKLQNKELGFLVWKPQLSTFGIFVAQKWGVCVCVCGHSMYKLS